MLSAGQQPGEICTKSALRQTARSHTPAASICLVC